MAVDATKLIIPGNGTVFQSLPHAPLPADPLSAFNLTGPAPAGWSNLGHTSKQNTIAFSKEGGDSTQIDTFLMDAVEVVYSSVAWSLGIPALQFDQETLDLAFNGGWDPATNGYIVPGKLTPVGAGLFLLFQGRASKLGFWIPNTTVTMGDAPSVDTENFMELPLSASILSADSGTIPPVDGVPGIMEIFKSGLIAPASEWTVTLSGTPAGGTFKLIVNGSSTAPIAYNAATSAVQTALNALPGVTATVTGTAGGPYTVEFSSPLGLAADGNGLTGGTAPSVSVAPVL